MNRIEDRVYNRKLCVSDGKDGYRLRVSCRKGKGKQSSRLLIKCGDCDSAIQVYFDSEGLEIGGVHASLDEWRDVLLPLLTPQ